MKNLTGGSVEPSMLLVVLCSIKSGVPCKFVYNEDLFWIVNCS